MSGPWRALLLGRTLFRVKGLSPLQKHLVESTSAHPPSSCSGFGPGVPYTAEEAAAIEEGVRQGRFRWVDCACGKRHAETTIEGRMAYRLHLLRVQT